MRPLIEFHGSVSAHHDSGAVGLSLRGEARDAARRSVELLFSGVVQIAPALPPILHAVRVLEPAAEPAVMPPPAQTAGPLARRFRIEASEGEYLVSARAVQLHAGARAAFFGVLPRTRVAPLRRWGWWLLLWLLRWLPLARLIGTRRA